SSRMSVVSVSMPTSIRPLILRCQILRYQSIVGPVTDPCYGGGGVQAGATPGSGGRFRKPVDGLHPDGGEGVDGALVVEAGFHPFAPLTEPDVAEVLQHRRQGRGGEDRIDAGAETRRLGA